MMRISLYSLIFLSLFFQARAQTATDIGVWLDHLPYSNLVDVQAQGDVIYCATEQGLFIYDHADKSIDRLSKVNGLSDVGISTIGWSQKYNTLLVGYQNGNIDLVQGSQVRNVSDIRRAGTYTGLKQINHIETRDDLAYICTDFGIVTYDLSRNIVAETFIIGSGGNILGVNDVAFVNDSIYAATEEGLLAANLNSFLFSFESWSRMPGVSGPVTHVENFNGRVLVNNSAPAPVYDSILYREGNQWKYVSNLPDSVANSDVRVEKGYLSVCNGASARTYDENFNGIVNVQTAALANDGVSTLDGSRLALRAASIGSSMDFYWIASNDGLFVNIRYDGVNSYQENITPNSPVSKSVIKMYHNDDRLFVAPGGISTVYSPTFNNDGFYTLKDYHWTNHSNEEFNNYKDIVAFISDPDAPGHFYASSYGNGILEFENNQFKRIINSTSTQGAFPSIQGGAEHRVGGFSRDEEGNIWFTNSLTDKPLGVIRTDGTIESYSLGSVATSSVEIKDIMYTSNDQVWIQTRSVGVVVVPITESGIGQPTRLASAEGSGNLPTERVLTFAEDQDGEVWIGTDEGLAVLYSPQNIFEAERNYDAQIIVIDEDGDGNGERVLGAEQINDIEVDGSNKKWFATANSGVYYTSENGKEQIYNFNLSNSPLPSNNVLDIEIDQITGMVYFATDQGIVSFQGGATRGVETHSDVFAYPNPVTPGYNGPILIRGLVTNAQVKITDIEGNIVYETIAEGGQAIWSGKNFSGQRAQSGVYLAYITNDDGSATAVTKILIVN